MQKNSEKAFTLRDDSHVTHVAHTYDKQIEQRRQNNMYRTIV
ncbi:MAG: hypothetical protein ABH827_02570 [bacterium]